MNTIKDSKLKIGKLSKGGIRTRTFYIEIETAENFWSKIISWGQISLSIILHPTLFLSSTSVLSFSSDYNRALSFGFILIESMISPGKYRPLIAQSTETTWPRSSRPRI
jgi:hypothetical protein